MSPKETVLSLYSAYAAGDSRRISGLLHEDVVWVAPAGNATQVALGLGSPQDAGAPRGANNLKHRCLEGTSLGNYWSLCAARRHVPRWHERLA
jgi:ketosteroid isomerase-like protein